MSQVKAGHLNDCKLIMMVGYPVAIGFLKKDLRKVDHNGEDRDFSGGNVRTSYLERIEYVEHADTSVIYTRNSIYFSSGNIISEFLDLDEDHVEGTEEIARLIVERTNKIERGAND